MDLDDDDVGWLVRVPFDATGRDAATAVAETIAAMLADMPCVDWREVQVSRADELSRAFRLYCNRLTNMDTRERCALREGHPPPCRAAPA